MRQRLQSSGKDVRELEWQETELDNAGGGLPDPRPSQCKVLLFYELIYPQFFPILEELH